MDPDDLLNDEREVGDPEDEEGERGLDDPVIDPEDAEFLHRMRTAVADPHAGRHSRRAIQPGGALAVFGDQTGRHAQWLVTRMDPNSGRTIRAGVIHKDATPMEFVRRFEALMPQDGEDPVTFYLTPLDGNGDKITTDAYTDVTFDANTEEVRRLRGAEGSSGGLGALFGGNKQDGGESVALRILQSQLESERSAREADRAAREADRERLEKLRLEVLEKREAIAQLQHVELAEQFQKVNEMARNAMESAHKNTQTGMVDVFTTFKTMTDADRERQENARREEREREQRKHEMELKKLELEQARLQREAELRIKEAELRLEQEKIRLREEREERERRDKQDREDRERREERERERRDKMDEERRKADREFTLSMEKMRQDAVDREIEAARNEAKRQEQFFTLMLENIKRDTGQQKNQSLFEELLKMAATFGIEPKDAVAFVKDMFGGAETKGALTAAIEAVGGVVKEAVKAFRDGDDDDEEEEEEEGAEGEDEPEVEEEPPPQKRPKKPAAQPVPENRMIEQKDTVGFDDFLPKRAPEPETRALPMAATPPAQQQAASVPAEKPPELPPISLPEPEIRAGRTAVNALVDALEDVEVSGWTEVIMRVMNDHANLLDYLGKVGVNRAMQDADASQHSATLAQILRNMGLLNA